MPLRFGWTVRSFSTEKCKSGRRKFPTAIQGIVSAHPAPQIPTATGYPPHRAANPRVTQAIISLRRAAIKKIEFNARE